MTFPTIPTGGRVLTAVQADLSSTRTFPSLTSLTKSPGDLLIAIITNYTSGGVSGGHTFDSWGGGFTEFYDSADTGNMCVGAAYKWSTGSETGTFTVDEGSPAGHAAMILLSIPGAHASTPPEGGTRVVGTAAAADPGSFDPSWGTEDTLWIAIGGNGETGTAGSFTGITAGPSGFTGYAETGISGDVVGGVEAAVAFLQSAVASVDAGTFTFDLSNTRNAAVVMAVRPAPPPAITQAAYRFYPDSTESGLLLADSYSEANENSTLSVYLTQQPTLGQSFLGSGKPLRRARFRMFKSGSPTGTLSAVLYAHTGTFGTSGIGTGSVLATSTNTLNVSDLTTSSAWVQFDFDGTFTPINGTPYIIAVTTTNTTSASLFVGVDTSSPTHAGNTARLAPTWQAIGTTDLIFEVYVDEDNALAAQDTAPDVDISGGDVNLLLRTRLQETAGGSLPTTDDWQLQWERNGDGIWFPVADAAAEALADSYPSSNQSTTGALWVANQILGQSFLGDGNQLTKAAFHAAAITGSISSATFTAVLYAHTGTFGAAGSNGTGSVLAVSTGVLGSAISAGTMVNFTFPTPYPLSSGVPYVLGISTDGVGQSGSNTLGVGRDNSTPTHAGCAQAHNGSVWTGGDSTTDEIFEVYTVVQGGVAPFASANLTDGGATTNRLTGGSGSFVAGEVSEDGLVDDLGWTANNYTELLYAITLKQAYLTDGDTLRFRVLRNGATTGLTYTQVPTINIAAPAAEPLTNQTVGVPIK